MSNLYLHQDTAYRSDSTFFYGTNFPAFTEIKKVPWHVPIVPHTHVKFARLRIYAGALNWQSPTLYPKVRIYE